VTLGTKEKRLLPPCLKLLTIAPSAPSLPPASSAKIPYPWVIRDAYPVSSGHSLIILKRHIASLPFS
jgi:hypothetical protein